MLLRALINQLSKMIEELRIALPGWLIYLAALLRGLKLGGGEGGTGKHVLN